MNIAPCHNIRITQAIRILLGIGTLIVSGCCSTQKTGATRLSGYTYVPLDPLSVQLNPASAAPGVAYANMDFLKMLPDNAVRMSVEHIDSKGNVSYGPVGVTASGESYHVTVDYINADTTNIRLFFTPSAEVNVSSDTPTSRGFIREGGLSYSLAGKDYIVSLATKGGASVPVNIPVYVGIGLRVTADIKALKGKLNISGLGAIGAEAEASNLTGSLVVQTLGINGSSIAAALPIQSELNRTTAQNAVVAVGAIKALLYDTGDKVFIRPRVVGIYLPFSADRELVNKIISEISQQKIAWPEPLSKNQASVLPN